MTTHSLGLGLGLDVGGTHTRWALANTSGTVLADGVAGGFSGQHMATAASRDRVASVLKEVADAARAQGHGRIAAVWAGVTGHDEQAGPLLGRLMAGSFGVPGSALTLGNDVEMAARLCFAPGAGHLVYSGTGSIGIHIDARGQVHRVGGRGSLLGDEGSGYWIARQALAAVWQAEDEAPGSSAASGLAQGLFAQLGGSDWDTTRRFVHRAERGEFGNLSLAVAEAALGHNLAYPPDPVALRILQQAGRELARLADLLLRQHGPRPLWLVGRASALHPAVSQAVVAALPADAVVELHDLQSHRDAALRAAQCIN
jgi:glucosamine kinase